MAYLKRQLTFLGKTQLTMKKDDNDDKKNVSRRHRSLRISHARTDFTKAADVMALNNPKAKKNRAVGNNGESLIGKCLVYIGSSSSNVYDHAVIYINECTAEMVRGIMINKLLFGTAAIECRTKPDTNDPILKNVYEDLYQGGPENPAHGYVLFPKEDVTAEDAFADVHGDIAVSTSFGVLQDILDGEGPKKKIIAMGHCEWHRGELEWEIFNNQWLIIPSSIDIMFDTALENRWQKAIDSTGFNEMLAITQVGLA